MDIDELSAKATKVMILYTTENSIPLNGGFLIAKLLEEAGEVSKAYLSVEGYVRSSQRKSDEEARLALSSELADVIGMALVLSKHYGLDLQDAFERKWFSHLK